MLRHILRLAVLALISAAVPAQTLDKVIPLGSQGADVDWPVRISLDSASNTYYVGDEDGVGIVAIDGTTHRRVGFVRVEEWEPAQSLFSIPGLDRVCYVGSYVVLFIETTTRAVVASWQLGPPSLEFSGGGCNSLNGKVYCAFEDSVLVFDGVTGEVRARLEIGSTEDFELRMPFAASPASNKVYFYAAGRPGNTASIAVVDGAGDSVRARVRLGERAYVSAMCHDDRNDIVWCGVGDSCCRVIGIDCRTDSIVADIRVSDIASPLAIACTRVFDRVYLATDGEGLAVVDAGARRLAGRVNTRGWITEMAVCESRQKLYCTDEELEDLLVYNLEWEQFVEEVEGVDCPIGVCWNPTTDEVACIIDNRSAAYFVDANRDSVVAVTSTKALPHNPWLDSANQRLYIAGPDPGVVSVIDCLEDTLVGEVTVGFEVSALCWSEAGQRLFAACRYGDSVAVIDPAAMAVTGYLLLPYTRLLLADRDRVYCCGWADTCITVLAGDDGRVLATIPVGESVSRGCVSPEDDRLFLLTGGGSLAVVDLVSDSLVAMMPTRSGGHDFLLAVPAEGRLYCPNDRGSLSVYDTRSNRLHAEPYLGSEPVAACYDPPARQVFVALANGEVVRLDARGDTVTGRVGLPGPVRALFYNRTSGSVCWVGDSLVGFIDAREFEEVARLPLPLHRPFAACNELRNRVLVASLSSVYVVRDREPGFRLWSPSGPVLVGRTVRLHDAAAAGLYDAAGRRVQVLFPGDNRLVGLAPGTYFLVPDGVGPMQKVVLPR